MKNESNTLKIESSKVLSLGRVLQVCASQRINDVQGFGWDVEPTFKSGHWTNTRVVRTWRQDQHKSDWD